MTVEGEKSEDEEYCYNPNDQVSDTDLMEEGEDEDDEIDLDPDEGLQDDDIDTEDVIEYEDILTNSYDYDTNLTKRYSIVNLDVLKIASKVKRGDYEPILNGVLGNLRGFDDQDFQYINNNTELKNSVLDSDLVAGENVPKEGDVTLDTLIHKHGLGIKQEYLKLKKYSDSSSNLSLSEIRHLLPNYDIEVICDLHTILGFSSTSNINDTINVNTKVFQSPGTSPGTSLATYSDSSLEWSRYNCSECQSFTKTRYKSNLLILCLYCFETGKFGLEFESRGFECVIDDQPIITPEIISNIIRLVGDGRDWDYISTQTNLSIQDSKFIFCTLTPHQLNLGNEAENDRSNNNMIDYTKVAEILVGDADNPVMALIDIISKSLTPSLGAYTAKIALHKLILLQNYSQTTLWSVANECFDELVTRMHECVEEEDEVIARGVKEISILISRRVRYKADFLKGCLVGGHSQKLEVAFLSRLVG